MRFSKPSERLLHPKRVAIVTMLILMGWPLSAQQRLTPVEPVTRPHFGTWGVDVNGIDFAVRPGDDFFLYSNGAWLEKAIILPNRSAVGPFSDLRQLCAEQVHSLLEETHKDRLNPDEARVHTLYHAFMDTEAIEQQGDKPLQLDLHTVRKISSKRGLARLMERHGFEASLFKLEIEKDRKHSDRYAVYLEQGGLGLPDRDFYLEAQFVDKKHLYENYATKMLELAAWPDASASAAALVAFETQIAEVSWRGEDIRDETKTYHPMSLAGLQRMAPTFPWTEFLAGAHLSRPQSLIVTTDTSVVKLAELFQRTPLSTLKAWEAFRTVDAGAPYLSQSFAEARFAFRDHALNGLESQSERWRRAVSLLNDQMGSTVGKMYVAAYFPPDRKSAVEVIAKNIKQALRSDLTQLLWMEPSTRAEALRKLDRIAVQMGYPARWRSYAGVDLKKNTLYKDVETLQKHNWYYLVSEIKQPWNKNDWRFWPQQPIAYTENGQLIFPAGMLQAPFFDAQADSVVNYGSIGHVIGHELTHPFDDQGRMEDSRFETRDWWTPEDSQRYKERSARLAKQYSAMEPLPGLHIKGDLTLGENIADLGGLTLAYKAYRSTPSYDADAPGHGFTHDQEFFLGCAQVCREKVRPDSLRSGLASDVHSPAAARLNGVVQNMPEWYQAFHVLAEDRMYIPPDERVVIW